MRLFVVLLVSVCAAGSSGCSLKKMAVNTVAKTYRALEADRAVVTEGRRGTFVPMSGAGGDATAAAQEYAATARRLGLGLSEATRLLEQAW